MPVSTWESLKRILEEALESYNDINAIMNLVLFEDAMQHVYVKCISAHCHCFHHRDSFLCRCRINRILESPRGNALLVGVGGSGKQSLTRLAAYVSGLEVFQIQLRKGYSIGDLKVHS
jgi:dynein heavy chain